ncbi:MAG TPA: hypothetical protein PLI27_05250 [Ignavibacteriales bacterium]|nr:hypothetical protein [Ignavibacteriales bacterium]HRR19068.1 hypothetical protein [Ignavibacteriales bacterium]HRT99025.1 hypothetical protein [Ignavibacteriales bacterium]
MIFPIAREVFPLKADNTLTINSGDEVPKPTIVNQITIFGILNLYARLEEPSTK